MTTEFFQEMVFALHGTILESNAEHTIREHCKQIDRTPDNLTKDDGAMLTMALLANLNDVLPHEEWNALDRKLKAAFDEDVIVKGKVKGLILNNVLDFIKLKKGNRGVEQLVTEMHIPPRFKDHGWYPILFLEDLLANCATLMNKTSTNCHTIGRFIIKENRLPHGNFWFSSSNNNLEKALGNVTEVITPENYKFKVAAKEASIYFESPKGTHFSSFFKGIIEGIGANWSYSKDDFALIEDPSSDLVMIKIGGRGDE